MVFLDYDEVPVSGSGNGQTNIYTTPYKCLIHVEIETADFDNNGISITTFISQAGGGAFENHVLLYVDNSGSSINGVKRYPCVFNAGQTLVLNHPSTTTGITLHVFRLPESE